MLSRYSGHKINLAWETQSKLQELRLYKCILSLSGSSRFVIQKIPIYVLII